MPAMTWFMHWLLPLLWRLMQGGPLTGAVWPLLQAVHDSGASTFVPCIGKEEVIAKTAPEPSTPKASGIAGAAKTSEGKASSPSAHSGSAAAAGRGGGTAQSPSVSPSKHLNLDDLDLKVDKKTLQKFKSAKSAGPVKWKLSFHLSVIVKTSGREPRLWGPSLSH